MKQFLIQAAILAVVAAGPCIGQTHTLSNPDGTTITYEAPQDILYLTATIPYNVIYAEARAFTKFGVGNNGQYKKPLILVEGLDLDISGNGDQGDRIGDRGWPNFISYTSNERDLNH